MVPRWYQGKVECMGSTDTQLDVRQAQLVPVPSPAPCLFLWLLSFRSQRVMRNQTTARACFWPTDLRTDLDSFNFTDGEMRYLSSAVKAEPENPDFLGPHLILYSVNSCKQSGFPLPFSLQDVFTYPQWFAPHGIHNGQSSNGAQDQRFLFKPLAGVLSISLMPTLCWPLSQRGNICQCVTLQLFPMACAWWLPWKICQRNLLLSSAQRKWQAYKLHSIPSHTSADLEVIKTL